MQRETTEQERFWAGDFGDEYIARNTSPFLIAGNLYLFGQSLRLVDPLDSILEFGANVGNNLIALRALLPTTKLSAVEINGKAVEQLRTALPDCTVHHTSIQDFKPAAQHDLVFTKTVLIHVAPETLPAVYKTLYESSRKYILIAEYFNPSPMTVSYRGHSDKLFKRDWAGDLLETYPDLRLVDYGFVYRRDPKYPQDNVNWFLLQKKA